MLEKAHQRINQAKIITGRDRAILRFIGQGGVASLNQRQQRFWEGRQRTTAQERLGQLVRAGYLEEYYTNVRLKGERIYCLNHQGANEFSAGERKQFTLGKPNQIELKQQLLAQDTRLLFEQQLSKRGGQLVSWASERNLRRENRLEQPVKNRDNSQVISDARATIENNSGQLEEIEIEIDGQYHGRMLKEKIRILANSARTTVWVTTPERVIRVKQAIQEAQASNIRVLCLEKERPRK